MKRFTALALLLVPFLASAASFWDGSAALQRGDAAFEAGFFAASNSFTTDTEIEITNLDTGKSIKAVVSQRISGQSDILVLLSPKAAAAVDIAAGRIARVRITIPAQAAAEARAGGEEVSYNQDPDVNPAVALGGSGTPSATTPPTTAEPAAEAAPGAASTEAPAEAPAAEVSMESSPPESVTAPAPPPTVSVPEAPAEGTTAAQPASEPGLAEATAAEPEPLEEAAILMEIAGRSPQKQLYREPSAAEVAQTPAPEPEEAVAQPAATEPPATEVAEATPEPAPRVPVEEPAPVVVETAPEPLEQRESPEIASIDRVPAMPSPESSLSPLPFDRADAPAEDQPEIDEIVDMLANTTPASGQIAESDVTLPRADELSAPTIEATQPSAPVLASSEAAPLPVPEPGIAEAPALASEEVPATPEVPAVAEEVPPPEAPTETAASAEAPVFSVAEATAPAATETPVPEALTAPETASETTVAVVVQPAPEETAAATPIAPEVPSVAMVTVPTPVPPTVSRIPTLTDLKPADTFFLQLGAFTVEKTANDLARSLSDNYPVVVSSLPGKQVYRVLVGPLNRAEGGTLLAWFKHKGYPDAFLKQNE